MIERVKSERGAFDAFNQVVDRFGRPVRDVSLMPVNDLFELCETLDPTAIAKELGAMFVKLNGPRHWMLDGLGTKVATVDPVLRDFNGITKRRTATDSRM